MEQLQNTQEQQGLVKSSLIMSIVGLVLSETGVPGWIVSAIAKKKVKAAQSAGATGGQLKTADILSKIGLPVSIVVTVIYVLSFIIGIIGGLSQ